MKSFIQIDNKKVKGWLVVLQHCRNNLFLKDWVEHIDNSITEINEVLAQPALVGEGWKLVPIEPTQKMAKAAADAWLDAGSKLVLNKALKSLKAGIDAAHDITKDQP